uniref:BHLH domain-containing protein n=1 Tax=Mola mola TaxID=94237 RepID=A0A3Q3WYU6_MOLML
MDTSSVLNYSLQYQWCSDSDLSSISSPETLSPVPSMDSSLSPSYQQLSQSTPKAAKTGCSQTLKSCSLSGRGRKTGRATRIRSKQRESASEKEKLRMRDLTKALHHLRSYLPPSVVPAGQTLTKIETLRLTIRYISYLSSQLGLSEEVLFQRRERSSGLVQQPQTLSQLVGQPTANYSAQEPDCTMSSAHLFCLQFWLQITSPAKDDSTGTMDILALSCKIGGSGDVSSIFIHIVGSDNLLKKNMGLRGSGQVVFRAKHYCQHVNILPF